MRIISLRVKNFRTIEVEQTVKFSERLTLVGPNSSGKTNFFRATQLFFQAFGDSSAYAPERDLTFGSKKRQTALLAGFDGDPDGQHDAECYQHLDSLHSLLGTTRGQLTRFTVSLYFTNTGNPVYQVFPNAKRPTDRTKNVSYSRIQQAFLEKLLGRFVVHYVPSAKRIDELYEDVLVPLLRDHVAAKLDNSILSTIEGQLQEVAARVNTAFREAGLADLTASFSLPSQRLADLFRQFEFRIADPDETSLNAKGLGIQSTALLAAFSWVSDVETEQGAVPLWLIEEPESYLHPELGIRFARLVARLKGQVAITTHSLAFVPPEPENVVGISTKNGRTVFKEFESYSDATASIRRALGVRFSDFYNLSKYSVFVEGPSDRELINWFLSFPFASGQFPRLREAGILDFGGVSPLAGFLRATWPFIRKERAAVVLFDGDPAGVKERRALQNFFGNKGTPFQVNQDFVSVRASFAIEGLFPDLWVIEMNREHPNWFESFSVDASGALEEFNVKDGRKNAAQAKLRSLAEQESESAWTARWIDVCRTLDEALAWQEKRLEAEESAD